MEDVFEVIAGSGGAIAGAGKTKEQIQECYHEVNQRHSRIARIYNSPLTRDQYTPVIQVAQMKWLERFAGWIQALRWVLDEKEEMPDQYFAIPDA
jgi:hypothetical protein